MHNALHFVGFKDDRIFNAIKIFGKPDFWHRVYDARTLQEIFEGDKIVFATGDENQPLKEFTWNDSDRF